MLDARYAAFAALSALLVISPGATLAVVVETALAGGRRAALLTVAGIGLANAMLAVGAALGLAAAFGRWPAALDVTRVAGGTYLVYLGVRGLWRGLRPGRLDPSEASVIRGIRHRGRSFVVRGVLTNLLNPPVLLFYMTIVPQFIGPLDPFLPRALLLGGTHVAMSVAWQAACGVSVGLAADRLARPSVRRALEGVTGTVLVLLGARLLA